MEIEYDPDKERLNRAAHGIGFAGAGAIFDGFRIDDEDDREDYGETRYVSPGPDRPPSCCLRMDTAPREGADH